MDHDVNEFAATSDVDAFDTPSFHSIHTVGVATTEHMKGVFAEICSVDDVISVPPPLVSKKEGRTPVFPPAADP
jgi:hypothetical protein